HFPKGKGSPAPTRGRVVRSKLAGPGRELSAEKVRRRCRRRQTSAEKDRQRGHAPELARAAHRTATLVSFPFPIWLGLVVVVEPLQRRPKRVAQVIVRGPPLHQFLDFWNGPTAILSHLGQGQGGGSDEGGFLVLQDLHQFRSAGLGQQP